MTEETRIPTMKVVLTIYDRDVKVEGENLEKLRNIVIRNIEKQLRRAAKVAKRNYLRKDRIVPTDESLESTNMTKIVNDEKTVLECKDIDKPKPTVNEALANLGIKLK